VTARRVGSLIVVFAAWLALPATAAPATNGRIVFSTSRDASWQSELYSVAPDGTGLARMTWSGTVEQSPVWSPDGTQIAFESFLGGRPTIHVMSAAGTDERRVLPEGEGSESDPSWSPDGAQIAFGSTRSGSWRVWVVNADGSGLRRLTDEFSGEPAWSPDGIGIAYLANGEAIAVVNVDGTGRRQLTSPPAGSSDNMPSWSPDASRLVFARRETFGSTSQLYVVDADGSNERQLTFGAGAKRFPSWSPDGTQIVFTIDQRLHVVEPDGSGMRPLPTEVDDVLSPHWGTSTTVPSPPDAPTILILSPEPRMYWPGEQVLAFYLCFSETSFVVSCEGDLPLGSLIDTSIAGTRTFTVRAMDAEGRASTASVTFEIPDFLRPTVRVRAPVDGAEYEVGETVVADYECEDEPSGSGIEACGGDLQPGQPLDTSRTGTFNVKFFAVDRAHNVGVASVTYRVVRHDRIPPTIMVEAPTEGADYVLHDRVIASFRCADEPDGSGLALCAGDVPTGTALDTTTIGPHSFTVLARDRAGNTSSVTRSYRVVYLFSGFFAPLAAFPELASLDAGETVPVKFSLAGNRGLAILGGSPTWRRMDCASGAPLGDASSAQHALSYIGGPDRYLLRVESDKAWRGTCRRLDVTLADGTSHVANVRFD
jgi:TolB protein